MTLKRVAIVTKPKQAEVAQTAESLISWFQSRGITASTAPESIPEADLCVVVGGDGTLLAAARMMKDRQLPILAINYGSLGFLTEVTLPELHPALERVINGQFVVDERMMIDVHVSKQGEICGSYRALNDVVVHKGTLSRIVELEAKVDGQYVSTFRSDGLLIATPTGSTAYNLSTGGPIMFPSMEAMIMTPVSSHTLTNRPIVLPANVVIDIVLHPPVEEVYVTVDGQVGMKIEAEHRVQVRKSTTAVKLIAPANKNYFDVLRGKLKWG
jgi:NAD+ kinase